MAKARAEGKTGRFADVSPFAIDRITLVHYCFNCRYLVSTRRRSTMAHANPNRRGFCCGVVMSLALPSGAAFAKQDIASMEMAGVTILIVRHAEKPESGPDLSPAGSARAAAYARYFNPFTAAPGGSFTPDVLIASRDTTKSDRPELTLEPLSIATGLPVDTRFANHDVKDLAEKLRSTAHGKHILIAWHHGHIPKLIRALGGNPASVLPGGEWPDNVYDWVVELSFDSDGRLMDERKIDESLPR
jgi:hypothetical protein